MVHLLVFTRVDNNIIYISRYDILAATALLRKTASTNYSLAKEEVGDVINVTRLQPEIESKSRDPLLVNGK